MAYGFMTIYWRDMIRFVRFKTLLVSSLLQPALWLAFFGIAMSSNFDQLTAGIPVPARCPCGRVSHLHGRRDHRDDDPVHEPLWGDCHPL